MGDHEGLSGRPAWATQRQGARKKRGKGKRRGSKGGKKKEGEEKTNPVTNKVQT